MTRRRLVIRLATGLYVIGFIVGCGGPTTPPELTTAPVAPDILAEATDTGAAFGLWATGAEWTGWTFQTDTAVVCPGVGALPTGQYLEGCTDVGHHTVTILASLGHTDAVQVLTHELQHVALATVGGQADHCDWSTNAKLLAAIASPGGKGGNFLDACQHVECTFDDGAKCE